MTIPRESTSEIVIKWSRMSVYHLSCLSRWRIHYRTNNSFNNPQTLFLFESVILLYQRAMCTSVYVSVRVCVYGVYKCWGIMGLNVSGESFSGVLMIIISSQVFLCPLIFLEVSTLEAQNEELHTSLNISRWSGCCE